MKIGPRLSAWGVPMRLQWRRRKDKEGDELAAPDPEVARESARQAPAAIAALLGGAAGTVAFEEIAAAIVAAVLGAAVALGCFHATMHAFRTLQWKQTSSYAAAAILYLAVGLPLVIYATESFRPLWPRLLRALLGV